MMCEKLRKKEKQKLLNGSISLPSERWSTSTLDSGQRPTRKVRNVQNVRLMQFIREKHMKTSLDSVCAKRLDTRRLIGFFVPRLSLVGGNSLVPLANAEGDVVVWEQLNSCWSMAFQQFQNTGKNCLALFAFIFMYRKQWNISCTYNNHMSIVYLHALYVSQCTWTCYGGPVFAHKISTMLSSAFLILPPVVQFAVPLSRGRISLAHQAGIYCWWFRNPGNQLR